MSGWRIPALSGLLVAALAVTGYLGWRANDDSVAPNGTITAPGERASLMAEGARLTTIVMSWRAASSAEDIATAEAVMTPRMRTAYDKTLPDPAQLPAQAENQVAVAAVVAPLTSSTKQPNICTPALCAVAVVKATRSKATLLLFVNQTASAATQKKTVLSPTWELVTMVKKNGEWLIDSMVAP